MRVANQYDVLKCLALVVMTIDHAGFFLFPEQDWMRILGRMAAPLFLVLVGYNHSFRFRVPLLIAAAVMSFIDLAMAGLVVPQNILWTILLVRLLMQLVVPHFKYHEVALFSVVMIPLTMPVLDFGSLGLLFALVGHRLRNVRDKETALWLIVGLVLFGIYTYYVMLATPVLPEVILLAAILALTAWIVWRADYEKPVTFAPRVVALFAASSLYYYIGHKFVLEVLRLL